MLAGRVNHPPVGVGCLVTAGSFLWGVGDGRAADDDDAAAIVINVLDAPDPPEILIGDHVDLGVIATEFLLLGLDPYPRKPDAEFGEVVVGTPGLNPFAVLAALKKNS